MKRRQALNPDDEESLLIQRAKTDKEAFGQLYELYVERIYKYVYHRTGNVADAEDLTARIFERAMNHITSYQDRGLPFSAWLYRIAHNLVANHHRDRSRRTLVALDAVAHWTVSTEAPEFAAQLLEDKEALSEALGRLPAERQELLMLKYVEHLSNAEIGEIMGRSEGAVKSLYHRTLLALREELSGTDAALPRQRRAIFGRAFRRSQGN
ncbi:MAG: RNA polymerase sigma factor [Candidatus Promineifilaceae bacterium]